MKIADVMGQLATQLDTTDGLRVFGYPPRTITPGPSGAVVVGYPTQIEYDKTYGRGMDTMQLPIVLAIGKVSDRTSVDRLSEFTEGGGVKSIKTVLEGGTYTAFDVIFVSGMETDMIEVSGADYLAAVFTVEIAGQGS